MAPTPDRLEGLVPLSEKQRWDKIDGFLFDRIRKLTNGFKDVKVLGWLADCLSPEGLLCVHLVFEGEFNVSSSSEKHVFTLGGLKWQFLTQDCEVLQVREGSQPLAIGVNWGRERVSYNYNPHSDLYYGLNEVGPGGSSCEFLTQPIPIGELTPVTISIQIFGGRGFLLLGALERSIYGRIFGGDKP